MSAAERLGMPADKVIINIERFGNTTAATIPLALNDAVSDGRLKKGDRCCSPRSAPASRSARCCCAGGFEPPIGPGQRLRRRQFSRPR